MKTMIILPNQKVNPFFVLLVCINLYRIRPENNSTFMQNLSLHTISFVIHKSLFNIFIIKNKMLAQRK